MVRRSKLLLALVVLVASAGVGAAYTGMLESLVSPEQLPGSPVVGGAIVAVLFVLGILSSMYLDRRAWKQTGRGAGLSATGGPQFDSGPPEESDKPTLRGSVGGRPVRARTYSTGGNETKSSKTYTVVEAELDTPVDWHAAFGAADVFDDHGVDAAETQTVEGVGVRGDVSEDVARTVLDGRVRNAVTSVEGEVAVGNVKENVVGGMVDELDDADGGMAATLAKGMLSMASDGDDGPSRHVEHRARGLLTDEEALKRRVDAVAAVADAVDRIGTAGDHSDASTG